MSSYFLPIVSIFMFCDLEKINLIVDRFIPFYLIFVFCIIIFALRNKSDDVDQSSTKEYKYKKPNEEAENWKEKFNGNWVKIERKNFYEVLFF
jgi:hypothetical protein